MKKWHRACLAGAGLASSLIIAYNSTRNEDILTPQDVAAWQATGTLHATSKPPIWREFGLFLSLGLTGFSGWNLWRLLESEEKSQSETNNQSAPTITANSPTTNAQIAGVQTTDAKQLLWQQINQPGAEWIVRLLQPGPLLIWGGQSSSKTTTANFITLLRVIYCDHKAEINDPHAHLNSWSKLFPIYGQNCNYREIEQRLSAYYDRVKNPTVKPYTVVWDEVTQYAENCNPDLAGRFLKSVLAETRKIKEHPILLSHNNTLGALAGGKGGAKQMQVEGLVELHLFNKRGTYGDLAPAMRGVISGLELDKNGNPIETAVELFDWMRAEYIYQLFPEISRQINQEISHQAPITEMPIPPKMSEQNWDYLVSESTEKEINNLIDLKRKDLETLWGQVANSETHGLDGDSLRRIQGKESPSLSDSSQSPTSQPIPPVFGASETGTWDAATFDSYFPDDTETEIYEKILDYLDKSKNASEIIKNVLRCRRGEANSPRSYTEVGKPAFKYLIKKYGTASLIAHFAEFLDKS